MRTRTSYFIVLCVAACSGDRAHPSPTEFPSPQRLAFAEQPTSSLAGSVIAPAVKVRVEDAAGNLVSSSNVSVTVTLTSGSGAPVLTGTRTVLAANGIATFSDLVVSDPADDVRLTATAVNLPPAVSSVFDIQRPAVVVDSLELSLASDSAARQRGVYVFQIKTNSAPPPLDSGAVIVGAQGGGFLRRVRSKTQTGSTLTLLTDEAALSDVVKEGTVSVDVPLAIPQALAAAEIQDVRWSSPRVTLNHSGILVRNGEVVLDGLQIFGTRSDGLWVNRGRIRFSPDVKMQVRFGFFSVTSALVSVSGRVEFDADVELGARAEARQKSEIELFTLSREFVAVVAGIPVYGNVEVPFLLTFETGAGADGGISFTFTSAATVTAGAQYANNTWTSLSDASSSFSPGAPTTRGTAAVFARLGAMAKARVSLYGAAGAELWAEPYLRGDLMADLLANRFSTSCSSAVNLGFGLDFGILSHKLARFERTAIVSESVWPACNRSWSLVRYRSVTVGGDHACGLTETDAAFCWGSNGYGALGTEQNVGRTSTPLPVQGGHRFSMLSAGSAHTCGLTDNGDVFCWGSDYQGQLGNGIAQWGVYSAAPVRAQLPEPAQAVSAGAEITCALGRSGQAYCWGRNSYGVLGRGATDTTSRPLPASVIGGLTFVSITTGDYHVCALTAARAAYCWGHDSSGQLGASTNDRCSFPPDTNEYPCSATPVRVNGNWTFAKLDAGDSFTCGLVTAGSIYCWGVGRKLGAGLQTNSTTPIRALVPEPVTEMSTGGGHACAVGNSTTGYCWGGNFFGQLGSGEHEACGGGNLACKEFPVPVVDQKFVKIVGGGSATCGIATDHRVYCWGWNYYGQLGNGAALGGPSMTDFSTRPVLVQGQLP
jgi:alpha-tubulin suppressor-like RCC1 family protein